MISRTLIFACEEGHLDIVKMLIENSSPPIDIDSFFMRDYQKSKAHTPLTKACKKGNLEIVKYLVERGAKVNYIDEFDAVGFYINPPLLYSINNIEIVKYLIENGADIEAMSESDNMYPLLLACIKNNLEVVQYLVEMGADINNNDERFETTPLMMACENGNLEIVKYLVERGADINKLFKADPHDTMSYYRCPLFSAVTRGNLEVVKYLVDSGANILFYVRCGVSLLTYICYKVYDINYDVLKYIVEISFTKDEHKTVTGLTPLICAVRRDDLELVKCLVEECGVDINEKNSKGKDVFEHNYMVRSSKKILDYLNERKENKERRS